MVTAMSRTGLVLAALAINAFALNALGASEEPPYCSNLSPVSRESVEFSGIAEAMIDRLESTQHLVVCIEFGFEGYRSVVELAYVKTDVSESADFKERGYGGGGWIFTELKTDAGWKIESRSAVVIPNFQMIEEVFDHVATKMLNAPDPAGVKASIGDISGHLRE